MNGMIDEGRGGREEGQEQHFITFSVIYNLESADGNNAVNYISVPLTYEPHYLVVLVVER